MNHTPTNPTEQGESKEMLFLYKHKWLIYALLLIFPLLYIFILSDNNYQRHRQLDISAKQLKTEIARVQNFIENTHTFAEISSDDALLEKYVRENMNMRHPNEEVFVIEYH